MQIVVYPAITNETKRSALQPANCTGDQAKFKSSVNFLEWSIKKRFKV